MWGLGVGCFIWLGLFFEDLICLWLSSFEEDYLAWFWLVGLIEDCFSLSLLLVEWLFFPAVFGGGEEWNGISNFQIFIFVRIHTIVAQAKVHTLLSLWQVMNGSVCRSVIVNNVPCHWCQVDFSYIQVVECEMSGNCFTGNLSNITRT